MKYYTRQSCYRVTNEYWHQYVDEADYSSHATESGDLIIKRFLEQFIKPFMPPPTTKTHRPQRRASFFLSLSLTLAENGVVLLGGAIIFVPKKSYPHVIELETALSLTLLPKLIG